MTSTPPHPHAPARRVRAGVTVGVVLVLGLAACGGPDAVEGTVVAASAEGKEGRPLGGGRLAVLDDTGLRDFLGAAGIDTPAQDDLPYVTGRVRRDDVTRSGGALVSIDDEGKFTLTARGPRTICRLLETTQVDLVAGCVTVDLPASGTLTLTVGKDDLRAALDD